MYIRNIHNKKIERYTQLDPQLLLKEICIIAK